MLELEPGDGGSPEMLRYLVHLLMLSLLWLCMPGCGQAQGDGAVRWLQQPILGGHEVEQGQFLEVVMITVATPDGFISMCSGTLISPRVVLTAAHCVDFQGLKADHVVVKFGESRTSSESIKAMDFRIHPDWNSHSLINDMALVRLERDAPAEAIPVPYLPASMKLTQDDVGTSLLFVGFGVNSWGSDGIKLWMETPLDIVCTRPYGCSYAKTNTICIKQEGTGICSGDSGGPALMERDGVQYVVGVNSYTAEGCQWFGCGTKVDEFQDFIEEYLGAADGTDCDTDEQCASMHCADGVCCAQDCDGSCQACNLPGMKGTCSDVADGTPCPDGNLCNGQEICTGGICQKAQVMVCDDEISCTKNLCDPKTGCVYKPDSLSCFDDDPCTRDLCDGQQGCAHEAMPDGTPCDLNATCIQGKCEYPPEESSGCGCTSSSGPAGVPALLLLLSVLGRQSS